MNCPCSRSTDLHVESVNDEAVVYDLATHEVHSLNSAATRVWNLCNGQRTLDTIAAQAGIDSEEAAGLIEALQEKRLMTRGLEAGVSRRRLGQLALATAAAIPIATISAPTPAQAASIPPGSA